MQRLILASGSPRRKELLARIGVPFDVMVSGIDESLGDHDHAETFALAMSREKARDIAARLQGESLHAGCLVLAADTVVAREGHILGKPVDRADAERMLRLLSGSWHDVITGMTLLRADTGEAQSAAETTRVKFRELDETLIRRYLETDEPSDKAGAYAVQGFGAVLVERIVGDYYNVMGLPIQRLSGMLEEFGTEPLSWLDSREPEQGI